MFNAKPWLPWLLQSSVAVLSNTTGPQPWSYAGAGLAISHTWQPDKLQRSVSAAEDPLVQWPSSAGRLDAWRWPGAADSLRLRPFDASFQRLYRSRRYSCTVCVVLAWRPHGHATSDDGHSLVRWDAVPPCIKSLFRVSLSRAQYIDLSTVCSTPVT